MKKKEFTITIFLIFIFNACILFSQIPVGSWRDHLPYRMTTKVVNVENRIYVLSRAGLFFYDKIDKSVKKISKIDGLSDFGISNIVYNNFNKTLFIAYKNGNIDFILNNKVYNISDIKRSGQIVGSKQINDIFFIENKAYLSCDFGIVVIDMERREVKDSYFIGENGTQTTVTSLTVDNENNIYASTKNGILKANLEFDNLIDFNVWKKITDLPVNIISNNCEQVVFWDNRLFAKFVEEEKDFLCVFDNGNWKTIGEEDITRISKLVKNEDKFLIVYRDYLRIINKGEENINKYYIPAVAQYCIYDEENTLWVAGGNSGLRDGRTFDTEYKHQSIYPNSPDIGGVFDMNIKNGKLYVIAGGVSAFWGNLWENFQLSVFENESWSNEEFSGLKDAMAICFNPRNPKQVFVASWGYGVIELNENNEIVNIYNDENSTLQNIKPGDPYVRTGGITFDKNNNLFVTNSEVPDAISVKNNNDEWFSLNYRELKSVSTLEEIIVTEDNNKWVRLPRKDGIFVFNENGTLEEQNDDLSKKLDVRVVDDSGESLVNTIYSITEDADGIIWVGTNEGVIIYTEAHRVFEEGFNLKAQRIKIEMDGNVNYLLKSETIRAISVDGANRKWIGTEKSGVFLISEDGTEQLKHFNENNSPLISNNIADIAIDDKTGEVFFGTVHGIVSYKDVATAGLENFGEVYSYPNPVKPDYNGDIIITGMVNEANVKITDISGSLIFETTAMGGQAVWNGKTFDGKRPNTGVYLIFCSNEDGSKTKISKLLFIN